MSLTSHLPRSEPGDRCLRFRAGLLCCGMVSVFSLLALRLIHLQFREHSRYRTLQEETHRDTVSLSASRGDIVDSKGRLLACDEPVQQITFNLGFLKRGDYLASALVAAEGMKQKDLLHAFTLEDLQNRYLDHCADLAAPALGLTVEELQEKIRARLAVKSSGELMLTKDMSVSAALKLRGDLEEAKLGFFREKQGSLGAFVFQNSFARRYPPELPLKHIVGFYGETMPAPGEDAKPARGVAGVERFFETELTGKPGRREWEMDGWGNEIPAYRGSLTPPVNGRSLRISLDLGLQSLVEEAMDEKGTSPNEVYVDDLEAERVIVVLFDPVTMGVRAIGCRDKKHGPDRPLLTNPVTEMLYEPGSTIKVVTVACALSSGKVSGKSHIDLGSGGVWDDEDITPITDEHAASSLSVEDILIHSSNIGAYKLARMLGTRRFEEMIRDFGFCRVTGFESPSESRGYFSGQMTLQTLSRVAFGNAIAVTPAQMCGALGCIINNGEYRPLHLAEAWVDDNAQVVEMLSRPQPRRVVTPSAAATVRRAMLEVVEKGTGKPGRSELFDIAGKTGTARKATTILKDGKLRSVYQPGDVICSFIGFLPADKPRLAGLVIVDLPRGGKHAQFGGRMAAPLFRRIAERAMAYYEVPAQFSPGLRLLPQSASSTPVRGTPRHLTR